MSDELENRHDKLLAEIDDWVCGRRSYINLGPHAPYTPDVIAAMDAQEVVKLVAALGAYPVVEATCPHGNTRVEACFNCMNSIGEGTMIDVRFTGSGPHLEFVECEDGFGNSINAGEWRTDGEYQVLRIEDKWYEAWQTATALHVSAMNERDEARKHADDLGDLLAKREAELKWLWESLRRMFRSPPVDRRRDGMKELFGTCPCGDSFKAKGDDEAVLTVWREFNKLHANHAPVPHLWTKAELDALALETGLNWSPMFAKFISALLERQEKE